MTVYDLAPRLPSIAVLRERCVALAVLERIMDSDEPYYTYTRDWGDAEAALMSNGSGDEWAIVFGAPGAFIRVFDHESRMSPYRDADRELWPNLLTGLPPALAEHVDEPAFADEEDQFLATAVLWRLAGDDRWHAGTGIEFPAPGDADGSGLLEILCDGDTAGAYAEFAEDFYETAIDRAAVEHVLAHRPLTEDVVRALNPELTLADVRGDVTSTGYPGSRPDAR